MKISITCITPVLQAILDFFPDIISFQHVFHLGVGRSQIEWKLKATIQISVFPRAKIGQNDHSNPYIESTTVLSDSVSQFCHVLLHLLLLVELQYLNNRNTNKHEILHVYIFYWWHEHNVVIFSLTLLLLVLLIIISTNNAL